MHRSLGLHRQLSHGLPPPRLSRQYINVMLNSKKGRKLGKHPQRRPTGVSPAQNMVILPAMTAACLLNWVTVTAIHLFNSPTYLQGNSKTEGDQRLEQMLLISRDSEMGSRVFTLKAVHLLRSRGDGQFCMCQAH